jgi:hypothetical protein
MRIVIASAEKVFTRGDGKEFDLVFNLAGETKYGLGEEVHTCKIIEF